MVTAVVESPLRQRQRQRLRSPLSDAGGNTGDAAGELVDVRQHVRPAKRATGSGSGGMRGRWAPPRIEIPDATTGGLDAAAGAAGARGYTSLRDIMSSSPTAKARALAAVSPDESPGRVGGGGGGAVVAAGADVHMIRHPLVKHAAYAYLQLTPSARDAEARRRMVMRRRGGRLCRVFFGCLGFLGALFGR